MEDMSSKEGECVTRVPKLVSWSMWVVASAATFKRGVLMPWKVVPKLFNCLNVITCVIQLIYL